jgi:hypothetical protein
LERESCGTNAADDEFPVAANLLGIVVPTLDLVVCFFLSSLTKRTFTTIIFAWFKVQNVYP